ncbi:MAG TPA: hypothetical protein VGP93_19435, partial [Polyangiaceae bacterium]|nr:hypothetical protein [Polyangiaceae bacterium]
MPRVSAGGGHALFVPSLTDLFELLGVAASIWQKDRWRAIHIATNVVPFEIRYGIDIERVKYNQRCAEQARRLMRPVVGQYAGFADFFVPVVAHGEMLALLVVGPVARELPTSSAIFERWRWLSGRQAHTADPEFAEYLSVTLSTLVLEGERFKIFGRFLRCLAKMMAGVGHAEALFAETEPLRAKLEQARYVDRMWEAARSMVDERTSRSWPSPQRLDQMHGTGLEQAPDQVLVALMVNAERETEPVDELLRRDAFQRACVELA